MPAQASAVPSGSGPTGRPAVAAGSGVCGSRPWAISTLSLLLDDPAAESRWLPQLAHVAAVALAEAVAVVTAGRAVFHLKWPNDLLYGPAKVAGILVEGTRTRAGWPACVIGWGVNCNHHPEGLPYPTTDLSAACGRPVKADDLVEALRDTMAQTLVTLGRRQGTTPPIRDAWLSHSLPFGTSRQRDDARRRVYLGPSRGSTRPAGFCCERRAALWPSRPAISI